MSFEYKKLETVDGEAVKKIYLAVGWADESCDIKLLSLLAEKSTIFIGAFDSESSEMVGMGRVLSDGISDACIQDITVLPEYRRQGIGYEITKRLIEECHKLGIDWIQLIASADGRKLYEKLGFEIMENYVPMKLKNS